MKLETTAESSAPQAKGFPRYCDICRRKTVWPATVPYRSQVRYEGVVHPIDTPALTVPRCEVCNALYFDNDAEDQVNRAFRAQLHLLLPEQIRANRLALALSRPELAGRLGVETKLLEDWEEGLQFQTRAHDNLMRAFFAVPDVRAALAAHGTDPTFGSLVDTTP